MTRSRLKSLPGLLKEMVGMADLLDAVVILDVNILGQFDEMKEKL